MHINAQAEGKPVTIFYVGDFDPAGVLSDVALERELRQHLRSDVQLDFRRIGITEAQVIEHDLATNARKYTVEAEAMSANMMRALVRNHVEALLPEHAFQQAKVVEAEERKGLDIWARVMEKRGE